MVMSTTSVQLTSLVCLSLFIASVGFVAAQVACPKVETVTDFNLQQYVSAPWYVHQQAVTRYLPLSRNYCVRADYKIRTKQLTLWGYTVDVKNQARDQYGNKMTGCLCAVESTESPSKLAVAPCFLPQYFAGPYWVVLYDESKGYALISGGQPTIPGVNGCRTGSGINNSGLWIFSRSPIRDERLIDDVRSKAQDAGFDISVLNDVDQSNCGWDVEQTVPSTVDTL